MADRLMHGEAASDVEVPPRGSTFRNSEMTSMLPGNSYAGFDSSRRLTEMAPNSNSGVMRGSFVGSARGTMTEMKLVAVDPEGNMPERKRDYKGRIRVRIYITAEAPRDNDH